MSRPLRVELPGRHYHVTSRCDLRDSIYADDADRKYPSQVLQSSILVKRVWSIESPVWAGRVGYLSKHFSVGIKSRPDRRGFLF